MWVTLVPSARGLPFLPSRFRFLNASHASAAALASVHSPEFAPLLHALSGSLLVTTYQRNMLIVVRSDGRSVHTHFVALRRPTGLAADARRLVVGTKDSVYDFRNLPALASRFDAPAGHDAVYLLRNTHVTGNIDIHEMAFAGDECWCVNTLFSCLCTLDAEHSFVPRWRPPFVSGYAPEDRCHLNGVALEAGRPRYVTAFGTCDTPQGWRANTRDGGVLVDVDDGAIVARGLSMPHSPRLHRGRLWVLESGRGSIGTVDLAGGGRVETVARFPGFTRGLDFADRYAFVGMSQFRPTNLTIDMPLQDRGTDRACGVGVVDLEAGEAVAFMRFSGEVEEIFAVQFLPGIAFPHIVRDRETLGQSWSLPAAAMAEVRPTPADPKSGG